MYKSIYRMMFAVGMVIAVNAHAKDAEPSAAPANMLFYMNPSEYAHPIKLWHFYHDYWYEQGPAVEPVAKEVFGSAFGNADMCTSNRIGNALVLLKPDMVYNPHMSIFYGKITAYVFSGSGKPMGIYEGNSERVGYIDVVPAYQVATAYKLALEDAVKKMKTDASLQNVIANGIPASETSTPCAMVSVLSPIKK
ncbi:hypothetical protein A7981_03840 [Methylovorus sp. MM2]|uniref:hypothetical protein n=1 Tax=Methylovorus sp. MM2 TaxID=1848038 RepID=UPI0007E1361F|nr:hypothetical protein [Methylovorus sp. MM2]OAM52603.1 hypothetical protein A7981_03840 [Methylovorus sp. MM2]